MKYDTSLREKSFPARAAAGSSVTTSAPLFIIGIISPETIDNATSGTASMTMSASGIQFPALVTTIPFSPSFCIPCGLISR